MDTPAWGLARGTDVSMGPRLGLSRAIGDPDLSFSPTLSNTIPHSLVGAVVRVHALARVSTW